MAIVITSHWDGSYLSNSYTRTTPSFTRSRSFSGSASRKHAWYTLYGLLPIRRAPIPSPRLPLRMEDSRRIPFELVLMILELAANQCQATARSVMLVCRQSHRIALPYVYRTVSFSWGGEPPGFPALRLHETARPNSHTKPMGRQPLRSAGSPGPVPKFTSPCA